VIEFDQQGAILAIRDIAHVDIGRTGQEQESPLGHTMFPSFPTLTPASTKISSGLMTGALEIRCSLSDDTTEYGRGLCSSAIFFARSISAFMASSFNAPVGPRRQSRLYKASMVLDASALARTM
jgi:hypothetical protein